MRFLSDKVRYLSPFKSCIYNILPANNDIPKIFDTNKKEIGIRVPDNEIILEIVRQLGNPIATTSLHNKADNIQEYFSDPYEIYQNYDDDVAMIIDGGYGKLDVTTIVDCSQGAPEIIRQGLGILEI